MVNKFLFGMSIIISWKTESLKMLISHLWCLKATKKILNSSLMKIIWQGTEAVAETVRGENYWADRSHLLNSPIFRVCVCSKWKIFRYNQCSFIILILLVFDIDFLFNFLFFISLPSIWERNKVQNTGKVFIFWMFCVLFNSDIFTGLMQGLIA